ncbi:MAG: GNAT family N-acetyltransferase [Xanthomonadales bacterium]|nr:GNAT family N-acetyltransferase [Xanthomonadales bacterium]
MQAAAYRVETERLVLRCWEPADAPALRAALDACDAYLRPWIPFMKDEPRSLAQTTDWLRGHRASFDLGDQFRYGVFDRASGELLGENMLLARVGPGGLEVGYWTHVDQAGRGIASEASSAMIRVGFELMGVDRIEIHCAPGNAASAAVPRKLGFVHEATLRRRVTDTEGALHDLMIWTLFRDDYPASPASRLDFTAYDCAGARLL